MINSKNMQADALGHPITETDIVNYLVNTPEFFERHAEVLNTVQMTSPHSHRAVSLQERQAEMLREKIKVFEHRIMEMIRHSSENAAADNKLHEWSMDLLRTLNPRDLPLVLVNTLQARFQLPQVAIKVWDVAECYKDDVFAQNVSADAKAFSSSLTAPFCGANHGFETTQWLKNPAEVQSLAFLPLRAGAISTPGAAFGLLILASPDPERFQPDMGTEFLTRIAELSSAALSALRSGTP